MERMLKPFGTRVAVKDVAEEFESEIILPSRRQLQYLIGEVVASSDQAKEWVKDGEIVLFQLPINPATGKPMQPAISIDGEDLQFLHYKDLIARLPKGNPKVTIDNFQVIGTWVLIRAEFNKPSSLIQLPDSAQEQHHHDMFKFYLVQKGPQCKVDMNVGEEVVVDANRCNPIEIDGKKFFYTYEDWIYGVNRKKGAETQVIVD